MENPSFLINAIRAGNDVETIKYLIDNGASVNEFDNFEYPIDVAVEESKEEIVKLLLMYITYDISESRDITGRSLLHRACAAEPANVEIVRCLLEYGVDVNLDDLNGRTALHFACDTGNKEIVQLLIDYGVDVNFADQFSVPAIYNAISDSTEILELLIKNGADIFTTSVTEDSLLNFALTLQAIDAAKLLLRYIVNLSSPIEINWNEISCAVFEQNFNVVKELLENGHEIDMLCLYTAAVCDSNKIFELLWRNVKPDVVSCDLFFMIHIFDNFKNTERIAKLWLLLNKEGVNLHLERCGKAFSFFIYRAAVIFGGVSRDEHSNLINTLASRDLCLNASDANRIIFRAQTLSNTELIQDIITIILPKISKSAFEIGVVSGLEKFLIQYCLDFNVDVFGWYMLQKNVFCARRYLGLFTVPNNKKNWIKSILNSRQRRYIRPMLRKAKFKSLLELSRDAVRKQLNEICTDSRHLLLILEQLQLPLIIKNIIQCKAPVNLGIYRF